MPVRRTGRDHLQVEYYAADADVTFNIEDHGQHIRVDTTAWTVQRSIILDDLNAIDGDYFEIATVAPLTAPFFPHVKNHDETTIANPFNHGRVYFFNGNWELSG